MVAQGFGAADRVLKAGDTMTGELVMSATDVSIVGATSTSVAAKTRVSGDTQQRYSLDASGTATWGSGAAVGDVTLSRTAVGVIGTNGAVQAATVQGGSAASGTLTLASTSNATKGKLLFGTSAYDEVNNRLGIAKNNPSVPLDVVGAATISGNVSIGGDLRLVGGTTTYRNQLSTVTTVANTITETVIAVMTIPAGDAVAGAVYQITAWGVASVTVTPTLTLRSRIGGVGGLQLASSGARTASSGITGHTWRVLTTLVCLTTGVSGTWFGQQLCDEAVSVAGAAPFLSTTIQDGTASQTRDTTVSQDLVITALWSAASASNTLTCQGYIAERVA